MPAVILDACGMINLYASGRFASILKSFGIEWYLPAAVEREALTYRRLDPDDPEKLVVAPMDLSTALDDGVLKRCDCDSDEEIELYVEIASVIEDDGESMGIAIASRRGWSVLTDDKKARRIAGEHGVPVIGTDEIMKEWAETTRLAPDELTNVLGAIERFARFRPDRTAVAHAWWIAAVERTDRED